MKKYFVIAIIFFGSMLNGCTDLDVAPYDQFTINNWYENRAQVLSAVIRPYTHASAWLRNGQTGWWRVNELGADQLIWPQKGAHGFDNGDWGRLQYHSWSPATTDGIAWNPWRLMFWGMGLCNVVLQDFEEIDFDAIGITQNEVTAWTAELRALRALHYLRLMCLYGNIPWVLRITGNPEGTAPRNRPRAEVFALLEAELLDLVRENQIPPLSDPMVGRMTLPAVHAMLVELYLNAEVWTGTPRWNDVITHADILINDQSLGGLNGRPLGLDPNINVTFGNTNRTQSNEGIFQMAFNRSQNFWLGAAELKHYNERDIVGNDFGGWNGAVVTPTAYHSFSDYDLRKHSWFYYGIGNTPYGGYDWKGPYRNIGRPNNSNFVLQTEEFQDMPLIYSYSPVKAVVSVSGTSTTPIADREITITEWYAPEFPDDYHKLLIQEALNGTVTKSGIIGTYDDGLAGYNEFYLAGARVANATQYPWSRNAEDYRHIWGNCSENVGARENKYHYGAGNASNSGNNNWLVYRMTWIHFAKAEALLRTGRASEAVEIVNNVKRRAFVNDVTGDTYWNSPEAVTNLDRYTAETLTLDEFLAERGREFIFEGWRRTDLIRFDKWEYGIDGWWGGLNRNPMAKHPERFNTDYADRSDGTANRLPSRRIFPIPANAFNSNPNLKQNPGYPDGDPEGSPFVNN